MANGEMKTRSTATGHFIVGNAKGSARGSKVKFGGVTVSGVKPSAASVRVNVERSTQALERVSKSLARSGVTLRAKKDVPQFSVAEGERGIFIRRLNGRVERGRMVNGQFMVID
jgi:hypothetical protein